MATSARMSVITQGMLEHEVNSNVESPVAMGVCSEEFGSSLHEVQG